MSEISGTVLSVGGDLATLFHRQRIRSYLGS